MRSPYLDNRDNNSDLRNRGLALIWCGFALFLLIDDKTEKTSYYLKCEQQITEVFRWTIVSPLALIIR